MSVEQERVSQTPVHGSETENAKGPSTTVPSSQWGHLEQEIKRLQKRYEEQQKELKRMTSASKLVEAELVEPLKKAAKMAKDELMKALAKCGLSLDDDKSYLSVLENETYWLVESSELDHAGWVICPSPSPSKGKPKSLHTPLHSRLGMRDPNMPLEMEMTAAAVVSSYPRGQAYRKGKGKNRKKQRKKEVLRRYDPQDKENIAASGNGQGGGTTPTTFFAKPLQSATSPPPDHHSTPVPSLTAPVSTSGVPAQLVGKAGGCTDKAQSPSAVVASAAPAAACGATMSMPWAARVECPDCGLSVANPHYASPDKPSSPLPLNSPLRAALEQKAVPVKCEACGCSFTFGGQQKQDEVVSSGKGKREEGDDCEVSADSPGPLETVPSGQLTSVLESAMSAIEQPQ